MASFEEQMRDIIKNRTGVTEEIFRAVALQVTEKVITRTPVDTGRARGNWNAEIDKEDETTNDSRTAAQALALAQGKALKAEIGQRFTLVNGLPYIQKLEYGYSRQAPKGMVRITAEEFNSIIRELTRKYGG